MGRHRYTSAQGSAAANARWSAAHAGLPARPAPVSLDGKLLRRVVVEDLLVGARHELSFYGTSRNNCYDVLVDGSYWKTCGWSAALAKVRKSCVRIRRER